MYISKYLRNMYKYGVKLYFCGKPVTPFFLRCCLNGESGLRVSTVYDESGCLKEVHYRRCRTP
ncbi:MAG: hypothetical protein K6E32_05060 [Lachnospiraceae bacterium]|nr:hypothetical protein [Lachnospiraceae bacterium]